EFLHPRATPWPNGPVPGQRTPTGQRTQIPAHKSLLGSRSAKTDKRHPRSITPGGGHVQRAGTLCPPPLEMSVCSRQREVRATASRSLRLPVESVQGLTHKETGHAKKIASGFVRRTLHSLASSSGAGTWPVGTATTARPPARLVADVQRSAGDRELAD